MMFKNQLTIVKKDSNGILSDLLKTKPKIRDTQDFVEACAMADVCKANHNHMSSLETYEECLGLQRRLIHQMKMRAAETANEHRKLSTDIADLPKTEPTSFEEALAVSLQAAEVAAGGSGKVRLISKSLADQAEEKEPKAEVPKTSPLSKRCQEEALTRQVKLLGKKCRRPRLNYLLPALIRKNIPL